MTAAREPAGTRFDRILAEHGASLSRLAYGYEREAAAREDLVQDIALAIWTALPRFRGECSERTFVYRIAHNRALTHACRRRPGHQALDALGEAHEPVDPAPRPDEHAERSDHRDWLRSAIRRLPLGHRQVVMLWLEELSNAEIGEVLGITENNVAVRLSRARTELKSLLEERP